MRWSALLDIGSTYTKGIAVDLETGMPLSSTRVPSSVEIDVGMGVDTTVSNLVRAVGFDPDESYASSSAQGGLAVVAIGLVPRFTLEAALQAALGAGAKVLEAFGYKLTPSDVEAIGLASPDVVILAGGIDGGDESTIIENARRLASGLLPGTVIVAGNRVAAPVAADILGGSGWDVRVQPNILPQLDRLDVEPVRLCLRELFLDRITEAKGIEQAARKLDGVVMPTPSAVLRAGEVLAGLAQTPALFEDLMIVDVGGATTDIISIVQRGEPVDGSVRIGLPEPTVKRTVEGDLGLRHNARTIAERFGLEPIARDAGLALAEAQTLLGIYEQEPSRLPRSPMEVAFDRALAAVAIREATLRHAGVAEELRFPHQPAVTRISGRDLRATRVVIGTGGVLTSHHDSTVLLGGTRVDPVHPESLRPIDPELLIDQSYALYACGLLAERHPQAAARLAAASLGLTEVAGVR